APASAPPERPRPAPIAEPPPETTPPPSRRSRAPSAPPPASKGARASSPPAAPGSRKKSAPAVPVHDVGDPAQEAKRKEIIARAEKIETQSYFEMLEVSKEASADAVRDAYFKLAKIYHPDRAQA